LKGQNTEAKIKFYKQLLPSKLDQYIFQIPTATDFTLKNRFFGDLRNHFMESGVVAINRKRHFAGMLTAVQLDFWFAINKKMIHGDKELFWLGLSIAGDEDYFFNDIAAASMGELTPQENKRLPNSNTKELCSNHPGHLDGHDERTLLWINAGMTYCKNLDILEYDLKNPLYKDRYNIESLRKLFKSATKIRAAIVPPPQEITAKNTNGNPENGWSNQYQYCKSYTWCAYETIGSGSEPEHKGLYVEFKEREFKWFDFIGDLWMDGLPASSYVST
jgi:alpha 1,3-mannosyltransferase